MADGASLADGFVERPLSAPALRQNWVLDPVQDLVFIIAAPLTVLGLAVAAFFFLGAATATALILVTHIVMTVAHHLPTFIRVYGDVELFARHRWTFLLAPVVPFAVSMAAGAWLILHDLPIENLLYVFLLAVIWDPWHFLMQHYGFMRIYDRPNAAPQALTARMDRIVCTAVFVAIMLASGEWLAGLAEDLYLSTNLPPVLLFTPSAVSAMQQLTAVIALGALAAYAVYLVWCRRRGYFVSASKLALLGITFGAMALAYTPNAWMQALAPGWSFKVGFAAIGIVHMTQYLAIVWRYNRGLCARPERARAGAFRRLHARGGWTVGVGYVLLCLLYGETLTGQWDSRWLMALLISAGLTSTLMHYYFDGFIWKLRQSANREHLDLPALASPAAETPRRSAAPLTVMLRLLAYFGLPLGLLSYGAQAVWSGAQADYVGSMVQAQQLANRQRAAESQALARKAFDEMSRQLPYERALAGIRPSAARETALALLIYNHSRFERLVLPSLEGATPDAAQRRAHAARVAEAAALLERALGRGEPLATAAAAGG